MNPAGALKVKLTIFCDLCGGPLRRVKTIRVMATDQEAAKLEAADVIARWKASLKGCNCKVCQSVIDEFQANPIP